jgi:tetratricopeptide (TPR) repeat protein
VAEGSVKKENGLRLPQDELYALAGVARQAAEQGRFEDARTLLEGLIVLEPTSGFLLTCLGCVYMRMEMTGDALGTFERALESDPADVVAHTYAGELEMDRGRVDAALGHFSAAERLDPEGKNPYANRARTLRLLAQRQGQVARNGGSRA